MSFPSLSRVSPYTIPAVIILAAALLIMGCANLEETEDKDGGTTNKVCEPGKVTCSSGSVLECVEDGTGHQFKTDCTALGKVCVNGKGCLTCYPGGKFCKGQVISECDKAGSGYKSVQTCDGTKGMSCFNASCVNACNLATKNRSYVGCEYWAADLDNAVVTSGNAASQQFAVALSNPSSLPATVTVTSNTAAYGATAKVTDVKKVTVKPGALEVLQLPAREVDGSAAGTYNTGGGTAVTPSGYRIVSTAPIIAYQFNPLSNEGVFSNDASLLVPVAALTSSTTTTTGAGYLVMAWPQTIAKTNDVKTNFNEHLRSFLTIVGTQDKTSVSVKLTTATIADKEGKIKAQKKGDTLMFTLNMYDVLNLETGDFGADFTGSRVKADKPVVVFAGSEASDVPDFPDLSVRRCCADHLEHQLFPETTLGKTFIALKTPSRTEALKKAGAVITVNKKEKEYFRIASSAETLQVKTSLPKPSDALKLPHPTKPGQPYIQIEVDEDFTIQATEPVVVGQFVAGQAQAGIPSTLPGGDPSYILLPPVEQFRKEYLFLTPDKYAFDFVMVAAPKTATVTLDGRTLKHGCDSSSSKKLCCSVSTVGKVKIGKDETATQFIAYKCQLGFPTIIAGAAPPKNLAKGDQDDGVHRLKSSKPAGLVVYGFDAYVSYGYPGGTDLSLINVK